MAAHTPAPPAVASKLAMAVIASSDRPLLLIDGDLIVISASRSFCRAFDLDPDRVAGRPLGELGTGEWNAPQLRVLLTATAAGQAEVEAYEMDLVRGRAEVRRLALNAHKLEYGEGDVRVLLSVTDMTDAIARDRLKDDLLREKAILLQEVQHRVANSLQIIASVLMQSARRVQSEETRTHLGNAHSRLMSVAALQRHLSASTLGDVQLRPYLTQLCQSISASMIHDENRLSLSVDADDVSVGADPSVSLGLIVTELVINALKHAFPDHRPGAITVTYRAQGLGWTLTVRDDGVGMSVDPEGSKPGLGTSIVEALANQLGARIKVSAGQPGTVICLTHMQLAAVDDEVEATPDAAAV